VNSNDHIEIVPLGGLGEFGMNTTAFRCRGTIVVVDAGLMFPRDDLLGVDIVVPELTFLKENIDEVRAVILTHGHEDHTGGLPFLLEEIPVPVYATPLTLGLVRGRLEEYGLLDRADLRTIRPRDQIRIGSFEIEPFAVTHSIPDAVGLAIQTPLGRIIHTSDFKFDHWPPDRRLSDYAFLSELGGDGVLALLSDSTNSERPGYTPSEMEISRALQPLFQASPRKVIVSCFASSIHRMQIVLDLAASCGRSVVPLGRSMVQNIAIAKTLGYLSDKNGVLMEAHEGSRLPDDRLVLLCSGSQGEPMAALAQLALEKHKHFDVAPGDTVIISARAIPGNQTRVSRLINHFYRRGARVHEEASMLVHASGHAASEELRLMLNLTRPRFFVPIHGEYRQLYRHAQIAEEAGIPKDQIRIVETGDIIHLTPDSMEISGRAPVGRRLIDEGGITELDACVVRDRQRLSEDGIVLAVVAVNKSTGRVEGLPELVSRGHVQETGLPALLAEARQIMLTAMKDCSPEELSDSVFLTDLVRTELKRFFRKRTATRPMIVPVVLEI